MIKLETKHAFLKENVKDYQSVVDGLHQQLMNKECKGNDYVGWVEWPNNYDKEEFARIKEAAQKIRSDSDVLLVAGIGGSYLGARAVVEAVKGLYHNDTEDGLKIYFCGNTISPTALNDIIKLTKGKRFSINVISKSGTTTEPALAFRVLRGMMERRYGKEAAERIYCTTDRARGTLKSLADREGWQTFVIPDDVGGRYSVLTAVGLLPMAVAGIDIDAVLRGAEKAMTELDNDDFSHNPCYRYAALRNILLRRGKAIEIYASYEPRFTQMGEWLKQLYGESEGKENKGVFPASVEFTADLHSMGQYIQQGERMLMETVVRFAPAEQQMVVPFDEANGDGLNFLAGKTMDFINRQAMDGTLLAHVEGGVPNIILNLDENNARTMGQLIYFFEYACGLSGYLLGVNPFDQPGVEAYKKNMFALLGKPGYEEMGEQLRKRLR